MLLVAACGVTQTAPAPSLAPPDVGPDDACKVDDDCVVANLVERGREVRSGALARIAPGSRGRAMRGAPRCGSAPSRFSAGQEPCLLAACGVA